MLLEKVSVVGKKFQNEGAKQLVSVIQKGSAL